MTLMVYLHVMMCPTGTACYALTMTKTSALSPKDIKLTCLLHIHIDRDLCHDIHWPRVEFHCSYMLPRSTGGWHCSKRSTLAEHNAYLSLLAPPDHHQRCMRQSQFFCSLAALQPERLLKGENLRLGHHAGSSWCSLLLSHRLCHKFGSYWETQKQETQSLEKEDLCLGIITGVCNQEQPQQKYSSMKPLRGLMADADLGAAVCGCTQQLAGTVMSV